MYSRIYTLSSTSIEQVIWLHIIKFRARRALTQIKDAPLRTRRVLSLYKVYEYSALLVLNHNGTWLMPFWLSADDLFNDRKKCCISFSSWEPEGWFWKVLRSFRTQWTCNCCLIILTGAVPKGGGGGAPPPPPHDLPFFSLVSSEVSHVRWY